MAEADDGRLFTLSELSVSQRDVDLRDQHSGPAGPEQLGLSVLGAFIKESLDGIALAYNERTAQLTRAVSSAGERSAYTRKAGGSNPSPPTRTLRE